MVNFNEGKVRKEISEYSFILSKAITTLLFVCDESYTYMENVKSKQRNIENRIEIKPLAHYDRLNLGLNLIMGNSRCKDVWRW